MSINAEDLESIKKQLRERIVKSDFAAKYEEYLVPQDGPLSQYGDKEKYDFLVTKAVKINLKGFKSDGICLRIHGARRFRDYLGLTSTPSRDEEVKSEWLPKGCKAIIPAHPGDNLYVIQVYPGMTFESLSGESADENLDRLVEAVGWFLDFLNDRNVLQETQKWSATKTDSDETKVEEQVGEELVGDSVKPCFWKLSIDSLKDEDKDMCRKGSGIKLQLNKKTNNKMLGKCFDQFKSFAYALRKGDFVFICEKSSVLRLVQIADDENLKTKTETRKCTEKAMAGENGRSISSDKAWMPSADTVFARVPDCELGEFTDTILKPCFDLDARTLQKDGGVPGRFWWLNARNDVWQKKFKKTLKDFKVGEESSYTVQGENGRRKMEDAFYGCREGDLIVGYSTSDDCAYSLLQCSWHWTPYLCTLRGRTYNQDEVYFKILHKFEQPLSLEKLQQDGLLEENDAWNSENESFKQASLAKLKGKSEKAFMSLVKSMNISIPNPKMERQEMEKKNLIYFGAPGTGKSFKINNEACRHKNDSGVYEAGLFEDAAGRDPHYERVTFHPDYSYANFVGAYKPYMKVKGDDEMVTYAFVPGPFTRVLVNALRNPNEKYLLVIEEINRANTAAVFGDVFQLLDRGEKGESEYAISPSQDLAKFLWKALTKTKSTEKEMSDNSDIEDEWWWLTTEKPQFSDIKIRELIRDLRIPSNMYLWATMNSADQGVFPMDTAFKRRWSFKYVGIDDGWEVLEKSGELAKRWNVLREAINKKLIDLKVNEDKCMGPFFLAKGDLKDLKSFLEVFKSKVLMYLFEDAARQKRSNVFADGCDTLSEIFKAVNDDKKSVFKDDLDEKLKEILDLKKDDRDKSTTDGQAQAEEVASTQQKSQEST